MVKNELIEAFAVSSLCLMLKSVYDTLHNIENKGLQPNFEIVDAKVIDKE